MDITLTPEAVVTVVRLVDLSCWWAKASVLAYVAEEAALRPPGDWIPVRRQDLMEGCGLAETTAFRALRDLARDGVLEKREGRGSAANEFRPQPDVSCWKRVPWRVDQATACWQVAMAVARSMHARQPEFVARSMHARRGSFVARAMERAMDCPESAPEAVNDGFVARSSARDEKVLDARVMQRATNGSIARSEGGPIPSFFEVVTSLSEREEDVQRILAAIARATSGGELYGGPLKELGQLVANGLEVDDAVAYIGGRAWGRVGALGVLAALRRRGAEVAEEARLRAERRAAEEAAERARREELEGPVAPMPTNLQALLPARHNGNGHGPQEAS